MTDRQTAAAFLASARPLDAASAGSTSGNDSEAVRIAAELREIVRHATEYAPRNVQRTLGPSELGVHCDRQVVHKLLELPTTNHVSDPWPSVVGTALHAWLEEAFAKANPERWLTERRVWPVPEHPGTADLYDAQHRMVIDHKGQGRTTQDKLRKDGPPRHYTAQILLYALGYVNAGYPVEAVAIASWPRTGSTLAGLYVWHHRITEEDWAFVAEVLAETRTRKDLAALVQGGHISIDQVPRTPGEDCYFCPAYRPQSAKDGGAGCPGTAEVRAFTGRA